MLKEIQDLEPGTYFTFEGRIYRLVLVANLEGFFGYNIKSEWQVEEFEGDQVVEVI